MLLKRSFYVTLMPLFLPTLPLWSRLVGLFRTYLLAPLRGSRWFLMIRCRLSGNVKIQRQKILKSFTSLGLKRGNPERKWLDGRIFCWTNAPVTGDFYMQKAYLVWLLDPCWKSDLEQVKWNIDNCRRLVGCGDLFLLIVPDEIGSFCWMPRMVKQKLPSHKPQ